MVASNLGELNCCYCGYQLYYEPMITINNETELQKVGAQFASVCRPPLVVYLLGQLGAGKTTFTRGFLVGMGYDGKVKSPTYTLVEPYLFDTVAIFHFDFYRIHDPEELELMGIREYFNDNSICLIEWPQQGLERIPEPDIVCSLTIVDEGRRLELESQSKFGEQILKEFLQLQLKK